MMAPSQPQCWHLTPTYPVTWFFPLVPQTTQHAACALLGWHRTEAHGPNPRLATVLSLPMLIEAS